MSKKRLAVSVLPLSYKTNFVFTPTQAHEQSPWMDIHIEHEDTEGQAVDEEADTSSMRTRRGDRLPVLHRTAREGPDYWYGARPGGPVVPNAPIYGLGAQAVRPVSPTFARGGRLGGRQSGILHEIQDANRGWYGLEIPAWNAAQARGAFGHQEAHGGREDGFDTDSVGETSDDDVAIPPWCDRFQDCDRAQAQKEADHARVLGQDGHGQESPRSDGGVGFPEWD